MRAFIAGVLAAGLLGCGGDDGPTAPRAVATNPPVEGTRSAQPPKAATSPPTRADGEPWPPVPEVLAGAVPGDVRLAAAVAERDLPPRCPGGREPVRFSNATIDEFALTATFSGVGEIAGEPDTRYVRRCTASFDGGWKVEAGCEHYAPAMPPDGVTRSGGGLLVCDALKPELAMIFIDPPRDARWIVLRRAAGYSVAYPVKGGAPVNVNDPDGPMSNGRKFGYRAVSAAGEVTDGEVTGYFAG